MRNQKAGPGSRPARPVDDPPPNAFQMSEPDEETRRHALLFMLEDLDEDRRKIEQARREWTQAFDAILDPIFIHDADYRIVRANRAYIERAKSNFTDIIGRLYWEVFPLRSGPLPNCRDSVEHKQGAVTEEFTLDTGEIFISRSFVLRDEEKNFVTAVHVLEDITEQRRAESERLLLSEALQQSSAGLVMLSPSLIFEYVNPAAARLVGYEPDDLAGQPATIVVSETDCDRICTKLDASATSRWEGEVALLARDGTSIPALMSSASVKDKKGKLIAHVGGWLDLRPIKQAQAELAASEVRFRLLAENASDLVAVVETDGHVRYISQSVQRLLGYTPDEVAGHNMFDFLHPDDMAAARSSIAQSIADPTTVQLLTHRVRHKDGGWRHFETLGRNLLHEHAVGGFVLNSRDITERKQAEEGLRRAIRAYRALSACNEVLVHAADEQTLLVDICRMIAGAGGYHIAWVGYREQDEMKSVRTMAVSGAGSAESIYPTMAWADVELDQGPVSIALRTGRTALMHDLGASPGGSPWREFTQRQGIVSAIALPLKRVPGAIPFGVLAIGAAETAALDDDEIKLLEELANDLAFGITTLRARTERQQLEEENLKSAERLKETLTDTIRAIGLTVEMRDPYTAGHQQRVAAICVAIGREMGLSNILLEGLHLGATIHDIGKIHVPAEILARPGKLSHAEWEIIQSHPEVGYEIVKDVKFPWPVAEMILQHHERLDGSGYPGGLKGEEIILEARILAVADTIEAMSTHRPYRPAQSPEAALDEIRKNRGRLYDPAVVDACLRLFETHGNNWSQIINEKPGDTRA